MCLKSWDSICIPKSLSGLGFRRMKDVNNALFSKLAWQVAANEDKLWVKQLRYLKYCSRHEYGFVEKKSSDSPFWKEIIACRPFILRGVCFVIGDGNL